MTDFFYIYKAPYIVRSTFWNPRDKPSDVVLDPQTLAELTGHVLTWCVKKDLIVAIANTPSGGQYRTHITEDVSTFPSRICLTNMRSLLLEKNLKEFMRCIDDNAVHNWRSDVLSLCIQLIIRFTPDVINALINRIYDAYSVYPVPNSDITWEQVHQRYPHFWIVLFIHQTIVSYTTPPPPKRTS